MKCTLSAALALAWSALVTSGAVPPVTEEIPLGFLPMEWATAALQKSLSPQGRYVLVTPTGPIRITDSGEKIDAARRALETLQNAPALVAIDLSFTTITRRVIQRLPVEQPIISDGIPVPDRYDPPRIIPNGAGGFTVIPAQPRSFRTRNVGPGTIVNPSPTGYQTLTPEVRLTETQVTPSVARRFTASAIPEKPVFLSVQRQVPDAAALHALALRYRAITESEPVWTAGGTEFQVTPQLSGGALVINVIPQIVLPAAPGQIPRRIPITACAAGILTARGAPPTTGALPKADAEFYRVFLGVPPGAEEAVMAVTVSAGVQYPGGPPQ